MQEIAAEMLTELEAFRHSVVLVDAPEPRHSGHKIRVCETSSPAWYSQLCAEHTSRRGRMKRPRTYIKRGEVVRTLRRIVDGKRAAGVYADRIGRIIRRTIDRESKSAVTPAATLPAASYPF